jgi:two-component system phosphate regulon sensor histidine kinase PhoR
MTRTKLVWQIFPAILAVTFGTLIAAGAFLAQRTQSQHVDNVSEDLAVRAELLRADLQNRVAQTSPDIPAWCRDAAEHASARITVVDASGKVLGDSSFDADLMENHGHRPEIASAISGAHGTSLRHSRTLQEARVYVAIPVETTAGVMALRTSLPVRRVNAMVSSIFWESVAGLLILVGVAVLAALLLARRLSGPIAMLQQGADRFARGQLSQPLPVPAGAELAELAISMNHMAHELNERIRLTEKQHNELQAVWTSMSEGVIAFDQDERVLNMNGAAGKLFGAEPDQARGRTLQEAVRHPELLDLVKTLLASGAPIESEMKVFSPEERHLNCRGTVLRDPDGSRIGGLVVLNDVSRLRRFEEARKEFVANVSHEIRTPVTSIQGYAETLLDMEEDDPETRRRFLKIVVKQAKMLTAVTEDILALSSIEKHEEEYAIELSDGPVRDVIDAAAAINSMTARGKNIAIHVEGDKALRAQINAPLLERAVSNLISNAIQYSYPDTSVYVSCYEEKRYVKIAVRDEGPGIDPMHFPRLFERFYRVDKARSRRMGGTGLGLAIVKHIAQLHQGDVAVDSAPGEGSTFYIKLPVQE